MKVIIKSSTDKKFNVECEPSEKVHELKAKAAKELSCEPNNIRLIYSGRILKDDDTLEAYKIAEGHTIHFALTGISKPVSSAAVPEQVKPVAEPAGSLPSLQSPLMVPGGMGASPEMMNSLNQMMSNPEVMDQVFGMLSSNPEIMQTVLSSNPQFQSLPPQMRQLMSNPEFLRMSMMMNQAMAGASEQGSSGTGTAPANPFAAFNMPGLSLPTAPASNEPPEIRFKEQLEQLKDMGFYDPTENIRALQATGGNVNAAVERLLSNM